jgi:uncharacterized protein (DUF362 family)
MQQERQSKVIIRACARYDVQKIRRLAKEALEELGLRPTGRTLVKPNVVISGPEFPNAYTRPEFIEGVLLALKDRATSSMTELAVGERCGITMPTRYAFSAAGYHEMIERVGGVGVYHFEEEPQVEVPLYHPERLRDSIFIPRPVVKADFFVNCPKFKAHPWTTVTFAMKNYIGIQDDPHRLIDHDHKLNEKVADLQYVTQPQFCAIDAITAGEGRMLTPMPFDLGLVIFGSNQVAFDSVCSRIIGLDPMEIDHIRFAHERGFGPVDIDEIEITGDVTLEEAQERASGFKSGLIRIEDYFEGTNIRAHSGPPPGGEIDYCWGGCPGALEEAIEILRQYDTACDDKMPPLHIVMGAYEGEIDAKAGERVIFIGDCASFHGDVAGKDVRIESLYVDRSKKSPYDVAHEDIYAKMLKTGKLVLKARNEPYTRVVGCPVSVAEQVLALVHYGGLKNPYFSPKNIVKFNLPYLSWRAHSVLDRMRGQPYQIAGPTERGAARPTQNLAPAGAHAPLESNKA